MRNALNWPVSCAVKNHQGAESEENLLHPDGWDGLWDQPWGLPVPSVVPQCAQCGCKEKQLLGIFLLLSLKLQQHLSVPNPAAGC